MTASFDLISEPWIPCVELDGRSVELGLRDALAQAHLLRELGGESPLVTAALHRLLLAVLHRVFGPAGYDDWYALWQAGRFDDAALDAYLARWRDRFDLFHPTRPFYQAEDPRVAPAPIITITQDMASGADATLFDHHTMTQDVTFTPAQSARFLLALQSFGFCGTKGPTMQFTDAPWARAVIFQVAGESLFSTLLLNMFRYPDEQVVSTGHGDMPAWEMEDPLFQNRTIPKGYLDYLTWHNRRIMLFPEVSSDATAVRRVTIGPGLRLSDDVFDPMKHYSVKGKKRSIVPFRFSEERALWRDSAVLFHLQSEDERALRAFRWLAELVFEDYLPRTWVLRYLAFGICSELGKDKTYFHRVERLPLPLGLLKEKQLVDTLDTMLKLAQDVSQQLWGAARTLATYVLVPEADNEAAHQPVRDDLDRVMAPWGVERRYWGRLEAHFRLALEDLPGNREETLTTWQQTLRRTAWDVFGSVAEEVEADPRALKATVRGREQLAGGLAKALPK